MLKLILALEREPGTLCALPLTGASRRPPG